jgi:hypothetical protein
MRETLAARPAVTVAAVVEIVGIALTVDSSSAVPVRAIERRR